MTRIDQSDLYRRNSAVFKNFVLYSPDPPSVHTEGLGTRLVSSVLGSLIFRCFLHLIRRADSLLVGADHSRREGEGKRGIVSLADRGSGKRDQS